MTDETRQKVHRQLSITFLVVVRTQKAAGRQPQAATRCTFGIALIGVEQLEGKYKSHVLALSHQRPLNALHYAALDPNLCSDNKVTERLDPLPESTRAKEFDLGLRKGDRFPGASDNLKHTGSLDDF